VMVVHCCRHSGACRLLVVVRSDMVMILGRGRYGIG